MNYKYSFQQEKKSLGRFSFHQQLGEATRGDHQQISQSQKKVLILHTGGTIGMFRDSQGKFRPQKNRFKTFLQSYPYFCDEDQTYFNSVDGFSITPPSIYKKKIWYKFKEFENLIDSTNNSIDKINNIMGQIQKQYNSFDAFVILHGTDTMAYTCSALSFMIQNLKKTIVITGAQVPMGEVRNDSINNLLCALTVAGHFLIPQVLLIFDNKILRGNRATKTSASNFNSFKSPNFIPLGYFDLKINIHWELIHHCKKDQQTKFVKLVQEVQTVKITPLTTPTIPHCKYIILQSLGTGNIPTEGPYHQWLKANSKLPEDQQKVIVNISQVYQSVILNIYATGHQAMKLGLIPGSDMTCQAAMTKLSYLASKGYQGQQLRQLMMMNLRDQLTEQKDRLLTTKTNYVLRCLTMLQKKYSKQSAEYQKMLRHIVYPLLISHKSSKSAIDRLQLYQLNFNYIYPDQSNILHYYGKMKSQIDEDNSFLVFLLQSKVSVQQIDQDGNSALFYFIQSGKYHGAEILKQYGAILQTTPKRIFEAIRKQQISLLNALAKFGDNFQYKNVEERNCAMYAAILNKKQVCTFFNDMTDLFQEQNLQEKDIYNHTLKFYMEKFNIVFQ